MQKLPDDLIEKFLSGKCTKEEVALVWNYLRMHPEEPYLANEFEQTDERTPLPEAYKQEMLSYITGRTMDTGETSDVTISDRGVLVERKIRRLRPVWYGAAAAVILVVFKFWLLDKPVVPAAIEPLAVAEAPIVEWLTTNNTGKREMHVTLPDSSSVDLAPGARIRYRKGFGATAEREVHITGKAFFDVAKNEHWPFTLYSEGLETRVLGTSFFVNANPYSDKVSVKLFTGKVRISLEDKDYYLVPGQELVFNKSTRNVAINRSVKHTEEPLVKTHVEKVDTISNWYMFNNQTLASVFDQLSAIYNIDIEYSHNDIKDMYFIGKLEKRDSLGEIIRDIAILNHLSVTTLDGRYIIKKKP
jgi:ferric-dicitrate binding protein FerR (iron transport regulator)